MTKFEQVGVNMQYDALTLQEAVKRFSRSCEICYMSGKHIECDRCSIAYIHGEVVKSFNKEVK